MKNKKKSYSFLLDFFRFYWKRDSVTVLFSIISVVVVVPLLALIGFVGQGSPIDLDVYPVGSLAPETITADQSFRYLNKEETEALRAVGESLVYPVYLISDSISDEVVRHLNRFITNSLVILRGENTSYESYSAYLEATYPALFVSGNESFQVLQEQDPALFFNRVRVLLEELLAEGVLAIGEELDPEARIELRSGDSSRFISVGEGLIREEIPKRLGEELIGTTLSEQALMIELIEYFIVENAYFDSKLTREALEKVTEGIPPVFEEVAQGDTIVEIHQIITPKIRSALVGLEGQRSGWSWLRFTGFIFFILLLYIYTLFLMRYSMSGFHIQRKHVIFLFSTLYIYALAALLIRFFLPGLPVEHTVFYLPTALLAMITGVVTNRRVAFSYNLILSLVLLLFVQADIPSFLFAFSSGVVGAILVEGVEKRGQLIKAGLILALFQLGIFTFTTLVLRSPPYTDFRLLLLLFIAGNGLFSGILLLGLLPIVEHALNAATPFRLIELSDINTPVIKRMMALAPGTYSHSLNVANLAEAAARDIGVNALLARVGAYYHDIGKIDQASYFIENQKDENKHDELKPGLSVAVIKSHVRLGVEKGRQLGLPSEVVSIIAEHHGSSIISYFYNRALNDSKDSEKVSPEDYSYSGPLPQSPESAIVMLADMVEAATRTLEKPTIPRLEKFVDNLVMRRVTEGMLSESCLNISDIDKIKHSFIHNLAGFFHSRIEYPSAKGVLGE